jgi:DNA polymerase epsilon subunit 1
MTKLFKRLVSALKKLGTKIIYADFSRIIIHTDKEDLSSAQDYIAFLLQTIGGRDIFRYIYCHPPMESNKKVMNIFIKTYRDM